MHSINPIIPFTPDDLRLDATIRHELIIDALVTLTGGNRRDPATLCNLPRRIGFQIGKVRIHDMDAVVMRDLGLGAIRQKLPIHLAATDHPGNGLIGNRSERLVDAMLSSVLRPIITGQPLVHATKWRMSARLDTTISPSQPMPQSSHTATMAESLHVMPATYTAMGMFLTCGPCS